MKEIYFSTDIETDGPIPGQNSMLSLGSVALDSKGNELSTFTRNFAELNGARQDPDTMVWWAKQPAEIVEAARRDPQPPLAAIHEFDHWVRMVAGEREAKPVFVGYPAGFDFMFVYWYLVKFTGGSPFSFSALDIKSFAMAVLGEGYRDISKKTLKPFEAKDLRHTHVALDDAREQGQLFINLLKYARNGGERPLLRKYMHHIAETQGGTYVPHKGQGPLTDVDVETLIRIEHTLPPPWGAGE